MEQKWIAQDKWFVSPYSHADEARTGYDLPEKITIRDVTLSEGQHQPGVHYTLQGMLRIARALYEAGITEIKQHAADFQALEFITAVKRELPDVKITAAWPVFEHLEYRESPARCKADMDIWAKAGVDEFNFPGYVSWSTPKSYEEFMPRAARLERYAELAEHATSRGVGVEMGHVDCTRASLQDLRDFHQAAYGKGLTRIGIYDSYGSTSPDGMKFLVRETKKEFKDIPILSHAHNDFGSAEATTIGGILGGASACDLSINGLGDRAGNAALEEWVLQLEAFYGIKTGVNLEDLLKLCRLVEEETGFRPHSFKPVAGKNVFTHESDAHAKMILEYGVNAKYVSWAEGYSPFAVGGTRAVRFGGTSLSGDMIRQGLDALGLEYSGSHVAEVSRRLREIFVARGSDISLEEFDEIAREVVSPCDDSR